VNVIRDGDQCSINVYDLQVGDLLEISTGDIMPVDAVYVAGTWACVRACVSARECVCVSECVCACVCVCLGSHLKCDESAANGESDEMEKDSTKDPFFISGAKVLEGTGKALVICVGENCFNGKTMMSLQVESEQTPLQAKLDILAEQIGRLGLYSAVSTVIILVIKYFIVLWIYKLPFVPRAAFSLLLKYVITAITIVVVAVPEGLPLAVRACMECHASRSCCAYFGRAA
jgi:Ca2+-transporting ATPase